MWEEMSVCEGCLMAAAGYRPEEIGSLPDCVPLSMLEGLEVHPADSESYFFSWFPCQGCDSEYAGNRFPVSVRGIR